MQFSSIGDLAQNLLLKRQSAELQQRLSEVTSELVTGKKRDIAGAVKGDFGPLATYHRSLQIFDGYAAARAGIDLQFTGTQTALEGLQTLVGGIGNDLLGATSLGQSSVVDAHISDAASRFESAILQLNTRVGDRYLLSGENSTTAPIADPEVILTAIRTATWDATTQAEFEQAISDWFDLPGGFDTFGYLGGAAQTDSIRVGPNQVVSRQITAGDDAVKNSLKQLATLNLLDEGAFDDHPDVRNGIASDAALSLIATSGQITDVRAFLCVQQNLLSAAETQIEAERTVLINARSEISDADPFQAASELEALQTRIETLYTITARNSRLSLVEYLR